MKFFEFIHDRRHNNSAVIVSGGGSIAAPKNIQQPTGKSRPDTGGTRINQAIRVREVRLIDPEGTQVGILPIHQALAKANDYGLDLVEISPTAKPPVCKIMDYGRFKYEQTKKQQEAKKKQTTFQVKEIKIRPKTGEHDLETKMGHIRKFIDRKDKVKVTVMFRGREITLAERGRELLEKIAATLEEIAVIEQAPKFEGRIMLMVLAPK